MNAVARPPSGRLLVATLGLGTLLWGLALTGRDGAWPERLAALYAFWLLAAWPLRVTLHLVTGEHGRRLLDRGVDLLLALLSAWLLWAPSGRVDGGLVPLLLDPLYGVLGLLLIVLILGQSLVAAPRLRWIAVPLAATWVTALLLLAESPASTGHAGAGLAALGLSATLFQLVPLVLLVRWNAEGRWLAVAALPILLVPLAGLMTPVDSAARALVVQWVWALGAWPVAALMAVHQLRTTTAADGRLRTAAVLWLLATALATAAAWTGQGSDVARLLAVVALHRALAGGTARDWPWLVPAAVLAAAVALQPAWPSLALLQFPAYMTLTGVAQVHAVAWRLPREPRLRTALAVLAAVLVIGAAVALAPDAVQRQATPLGASAPDERAAHARTARAAEIRARFEQAVAMLQAGRYDFAITALHRVLELDPALPEAHVNMGFALLGAGDAAAAQRFFETATELRSTQINAYYGLAQALEAQGRLGPAAGALRTYLHLAPNDEPFRERGIAALARIENKLADERARSGDHAGRRAG